MIKGGTISKSLLIPILMLQVAALSCFAEEPPIKVGATLALSGKLAFVGQAEFNGLKLAFDEANAKAGFVGRKIEFIVEDNQGEPKTAVTSAQKLLDIDKVDLFISAFTHITQAVKTLAARNNRAMVYISSSPAIATENEFFFRDFYDIEFSARVLTRYMASHGFKRIGYLREDGEACALHENAYLSEAREYKIETVARDEFASGSSDLKSVLLRVARNKPDALMLCTWRDTVTVMRQLNELNLLTIPTFQVEAPAYPISDTPEIRALFEKNHTISSWYGYVETTTDPHVLSFIKRYGDTFKAPATPDALLAYELGYAIADSMLECKPGEQLDRACFGNNMLNRKHTAPTGTLTFNAKRSSERPVPLIKVKQGKWYEVSD